MKIRLLSLALVMILICMAMTGCSAGSVSQKVESAGDTAKQFMETTMASGVLQSANPVLTPEEAKQIALKHAGLTADLVVGLHAQYEIEHGTPIYDVEFHHRAWEYDYEIHADTGEILSFSKDD